jgi:hydroxyethylthiazole kinase-like uncharacterized protein yjeF
MRAAEAAAIAAGTSVESLMDRAGTAAAHAIRGYAGAPPALILCGPGNNGGDGYVIARVLREMGTPVRVAALGAPRGGAAAAARQGWGGAVENFFEAPPAPLLVDALFGTGLSRGLAPAVSQRLAELAGAAKTRVAIDLPSGVEADDGAILSRVSDFDLTVTFGALKRAHLLQPAARHMGRVVVADIGVAAAGAAMEIARPPLPAPGPNDHKYSRGYVAVLAGEMPGAAALAASAAFRAGAGYVRLVGEQHVSSVPSAIVQGPAFADVLNDARLGALVIGPGLGRGEDRGRLLVEALAARVPLILDADALTLIGEAGVDKLRASDSTPMLTPHAGEFGRLFPHLTGSKVEGALQAARIAQAVMVYKGADTVVAAPDGRIAIAPPAPHWLATAGTGDVLAGVIASARAVGLGAFEAACAGVWLHGRAAALAGPVLIADDLLDPLRQARAECL